MTSLNMLSMAGILSIHKDLQQHYGGGQGEVDMAKLELAIMRAESMVRDRHWKGRARLGAQYGWRILKSRPFAEGNSRTALAALVTFLEMNCYQWLASEIEETVRVQDAAAGRLKEADWEAWVLSRIGKQPRDKADSE